MCSFGAKKRFGQHFLTSGDIINRIVTLLAPHDKMTVVEVGPGRGALTLPIARSGARVVAVELDRDLIGHLREALSDYPNTEVVQQDFLRWEPERCGIRKLVLVGNLPYNITSPVVEWIIDRHRFVERAVLMLQKETAARLTSSPGCKDWSPMAIFAQVHYEARQCFGVETCHFRPPPKVSSAVVELRRRPSIPVADPDAFRKVVWASFRHRRKLLANNLIGALVDNAVDVRVLLGRMDLLENTRAEEVSIERFLELTDLLTTRRII